MTTGSIHFFSISFPVYDSTKLSRVESLSDGSNQIQLENIRKKIVNTAECTAEKAASTTRLFQMGNNNHVRERGGEAEHWNKKYLHNTNQE